MRLLLTLFTAAALVVSIAACSDSFSPTVENVAGDYTLARLTTVTDTGGTVEWMPEGATFTISLAPNGTTTGHLFIPGANAGSDFNADMAGTWALTGRVVRFTQTADSFVRDMDFIAGNKNLTGDETFTDTRVRVVLTK